MKTGQKLLIFTLALTLLLSVVLAQPALMEDGEEGDVSPADDYSDLLERLLARNQKRSCIRRGGTCDHRPNDCCYNSSCRCNLWGSNCRCQRAGLFQQWGK